MSDRATERRRHRAPQRAVTPLTQLTDAVTEQLGDAGRTGAIVAISTGLVAAAGLPAQALTGRSPGASTTSVTSLRSTTAAQHALAARGAPLTAPSTAVVAFESGVFTAVPKPAAPKPAARSKPAPAKPPVRPPAAKPATAKPATAKPATAMPAKPAPAKAAPVKAKPVPPKRRAAPAPAVRKPEPRRTPATGGTHQRPPATGGTTARGTSALAVAARYVGTPYRYGGTTPRGFDCSGFTRYVYAQLGVSLPRTANQQMLATQRVSRSQAKPGDLVFFVSGGRAYHTGVYAGSGMLYDSPRSGKTLSKRKIWDAAVVFGRVRG